MPDELTPDVSFILGPPADPVRRALFDRAQAERDSGSPLAQAAERYEPRLSWLVEERDGRPSILSELASEAAGARVRVRRPDFGVAVRAGVRHAIVVLRLEHIDGAAEAARHLVGGAPGFGWLRPWATC